METKFTFEMDLMTNLTDDSINQSVVMAKWSYHDGIKTAAYLFKNVLRYLGVFFLNLKCFTLVDCICLWHVQNDDVDILPVNGGFYFVF